MEGILKFKINRNTRIGRWLEKHKIIKPIEFTFQIKKEGFQVKSPNENILKNLTITISTDDPNAGVFTFNKA